MTRLASLRFGRVLDDLARAEVSRAVGSVGATVRSWNATRTQTFASVDFAADVAVERIARAVPDAVVATPAELALRIRPDVARRLPALLAAFAGAGAPSGTRHACLDGDAVVVVCDPAGAAPALVLALVDAELARAPGRTIEALVDLSDATLAVLAGAALGARLDASRIVETHLARAMAAAAGRA